MKKLLPLFLALIMTVFSSVGCSAQETTESTEGIEIILTINKPTMLVNDTETNIDEEGTAPVIINDRTLLPVRAVVEAMGGSVEWNGNSRTVTLTKNEDTIRLTIDSDKAFLNDDSITLDTAPIIINERTMLPIRFIAESFNFNVEWNEQAQEVIIKQMDTGSETLTDATQTSSSELPLSDMMIRITNGDSSADFALYDTDAADEFYSQLPLNLDTTNFGDAQWMFYPPEKLNVKPEEAYHDGKKGELAYYEPWGDVFMLYSDFQSGDEMYRLGVCTNGIENIENMSGEITIEKLSEDKNMDNQLKIKINDKTLTATLAENSSAEALKQLLSEGDITINMSDYSNFEKVGSLGTSLPRNDEQITTEAGDLILYQGSSFVIYYDTNSWSLTRLGKINDITQEELKQILGSGNVTVTLSMD